MVVACNELASPDYEEGDGGGGEIKLIVSSGQLLHSHYFLRNGASAICTNLATRYIRSPS